MAVGLTPMRGRDPREENRASTPLELFFDLVFVVAISFASAQLHLGEVESHIGSIVPAYLAVFFGIWWAWMNFTWFATAFDTDDWLYRMLTLVQMSGVLVFAAGVEPAMQHGDFRVLVMGYVIMRIALVAQWVRVAISSPEWRSTAVRYAVGIFLVQLLWNLSLLVPAEWRGVAYLALIACELAVPVWGERHHQTPWNFEHLAERYGLFTIIVLGESVLASATAVVDALHHAEHIGPLVLIAVCGIVTAASMWWIYFSRSQHQHFRRFSRALLVGYGHFFVYASAAAFSAGIEVAVAFATHETELSHEVASATFSVPVGLYVLMLWLVSLRFSLTRVANWLVPLLAVLVMATAVLPDSIVFTTIGMVVIVVVLELTRDVSEEGAPSVAGPGRVGLPRVASSTTHTGA